jgi:hypothetical protein
MVRLSALALATMLLATDGRAQEHSDALFCRQIQDVADKANKDIGSRLDAVTIQIGMAVFCNVKIVDFKKRVEMPFDSFKAGWQAPKQAQWNQIYCEPGSAFRQAIDAGWTIGSTTADANGVRHYMVAKCT